MESTYIRISHIGWSPAVPVYYVLSSYWASGFFFGGPTKDVDGVPNGPAVLFVQHSTGR
jgi:hypothetical protein